MQQLGRFPALKSSTVAIMREFSRRHREEWASMSREERIEAALGLRVFRTLVDRPHRLRGIGYGVGCH